MVESDNYPLPGGVNLSIIFYDLVTRQTDLHRFDNQGWDF